MGEQKPVGKKKTAPREERGVAGRLGMLDAQP
jgi:hypothetical protein